MAFAHHKANGHAAFKDGELGKVLGTEKRQLRRALADAKAYGYLDPKSTLRCLVVPANSTYGGIGKSSAPCPHCDAKKSKAA